MTDERHVEPRDHDLVDALGQDLGDALAVPPLDDVTRRRLVRNALDALDDDGAAPAPEPEKRSWAPLVAAAVVVFLVVGVIVAVGRGGTDPSSDTAARQKAPGAATAAPDQPAAAAGASDSGSTAESVVGGIRLLGDLGDLSIPATRTSVRAEITGPNPPTGDIPESVAGRVSAASCASPLRAGGATIVGIGTATVEGRDAAVVVTRSSDGGESTWVLVFSPCTLEPL